jgi:hypothetical protein
VAFVAAAGDAAAAAAWPGGAGTVGSWMLWVTLQCTSTQHTADQHIVSAANL